MTLSTKVLEADGGIVLSLVGAIDEESDASDIVPRVASTMLINLDGVDRVTSYGVVNWLSAMKKLDGTSYGFVRCRPSIVRQLNMITAFGRNGQVLSIYLPYFCATCRDEYEQMLDLAANYNPVKNRKAPVSHCPKCAKAGEFDDAPETYFSFGAEYGEPRLTPEILKLLATLDSFTPQAQRAVDQETEQLRAMRGELQAATERLKKLRGERGS